MFLTKILLLFFRIGLCGFDNPHRDQKTEEVRRHIGQVRFSSLYNKNILRHTLDIEVFFKIHARTYMANGS